MIVANAIDRINTITGRAVAWLTLAMVLVMFFSVVQRYLFNTSQIWQQELVIYCHSLVFMIASGYTLRANEHVRVDIFYNMFSPRTKALVDLIGTIIFLFPVCISLIYFSYDFILQSWEIHERSREHEGLPFVYILKTCIWVFAGSLMLQGISIILRSLVIMRGR